MHKVPFNLLSFLLLTFYFCIFSFSFAFYFLYHCSCSCCNSCLDCFFFFHLHSVQLHSLLECQLFRQNSFFLCLCVLCV
uniref:Putative secreted protein n=1 Tax=Rhipicephalus microplus TaxID=6941 RepID=A0A6M2DAI8_RHIMP